MAPDVTTMTAVVAWAVLSALALLLARPRTDSARVVAVVS
jgi:hypothetical protein